MPDLSTVAGWFVGAVTLLVPIWLRVTSVIGRNAREVAELRGRIHVIEQSFGGLKGDIAGVHQRIGGVARTTDRISGEVSQMGPTLITIQEHLLGREKNVG